jgi:hypothetical protein
MCHCASSLGALAEFRLRRPPLTGALQRARPSGRRRADELHVEPYSWRLVSFHQPGKIRSVRHQGCDAIAQQTMRPNARGTRDRARDGSDTSAELAGSLGNHQ